MQSTIAIGPTQALLATIRRQGWIPAFVTSRVDPLRSHLDRQEGVVPLAVFTTMLDVVAGDRGDGAFGLVLGKAFPLEELGPITALSATSRTVGEALEKFTHYFPCVQSNTRSSLSVENGIARLSYCVNDSTVRFKSQDAMFSLAVEWNLINKLLDGHWNCHHVDFAHAPASCIDVWRDAFKCNINFKSRDNAIYFSANFLEKTIAGADNEKHSTFEIMLAESMRRIHHRFDLVSSLEAWLTACIARSVNVDIDHAASDFGMSLRSFQRKLSFHGLSFKDIKNRVRFQIAQRMLLETELPIAEIALYLGYSETSAFSRAFRLYIGTSPNEVRNGIP
ncbi:AraC family transcriptional regulator ligand-binding domain-containing protein [Methylorubrum zatmanii]